MLDSIHSDATADWWEVACLVGGGAIPFLLPLYATIGGYVMNLYSHAEASQHILDALERNLSKKRQRTLTVRGLYRMLAREDPHWCFNGFADQWVKPWQRRGRTNRAHSIAHNVTRFAQSRDAFPSIAEFTSVSQRSLAVLFQALADQLRMWRHSLYAVRDLIAAGTSQSVSDQMERIRVLAGINDYPPFSNTLFETLDTMLAEATVHDWVYRVGKILDRDTVSEAFCAIFGDDTGRQMYAEFELLFAS